jgi:sporulation protein YlmC with PRC-barrel domain
MKLIATLVAITSLTVLPAAVTLAQQPASSTSPQSAPSGTPGTDNRAQVLVGSDSLVGSTVRNSEGRDVGTVERLMIDPQEGRVIAVIVTTGKKLGMGGHTISVPWNTVKVGQDQGKIVVSTNQTLDSAPKAASDRERDQARDRAQSPPLAPSTSEQRR